MNPHKNMELKQIWFKRGEFRKLVSAVECNEDGLVYEILWEIHNRGDLN